MKVEARIFLGVALFLALATVGYGWWSSAVEKNGIEWIGTTCILLSGGLCLIIGSYFSFVARRIDARPEDRLDGEIHEGAGELGFFSPGSYWPFGIAAAGAFTAFGLAFFQVWIIVAGVAAVLATVGGLLFEYYVGQNAHPQDAFGGEQTQAP